LGENREYIAELAGFFHQPILERDALFLVVSPELTLPSSYLKK
jgi:hypothetical protein